MTPAVNQVWVSKLDGSRALVVELPAAHPDRVLLTPEEFRHHPDERRPRIALPVSRLLGEYFPEDAPPAVPPAEIAAGSVVLLKARCPSTPRMTVLRVYDGHFDSQPYTADTFAEVAYVPTFGDGEAGVIRRDKFPLSCLLPVAVHPRPEDE